MKILLELVNWEESDEEYFGFKKCENKMFFQKKKKYFFTRTKKKNYADEVLHEIQRIVKFSWRMTKNSKSKASR